ncbi:MAG: YhgE/Pip domain-containing protein [Aeriscardovia sp.]|nr:YhgE/Pip domain-containing protein [Aeriscardovia sp.]
MLFKIFKRDLLRLARGPASLLTLLALLFLPAVYGWFSTYAYSDPYSRTGELPVAVANMDSPASAEGEEIDVGADLVKGLKGNKELKWEFVGENEAESGVKSGKFFAAFVVPAGFSRALAASLLSPSKSQRPQILYFSNQESSPVTPKIASIGAEKIEREVNAQVDAALLKAVMEKMSEAARSSKSKALGGAQSALEGAEGLANGLSRIRSSQKALASALSSLSSSLSSASKSLSSLPRASLSPLPTSLPALPSSFPLKGKLSELSSRLSSLSSFPLSSPLAQKASSALSQIEAALSSLSSRLSSLEASAQAARSEAQGALSAFNAKADEARSLSSSIPSFLSSAANDLEEMSRAILEADGPLEEWEKDLSSLSSSISQLESSSLISFLSKIGALDARGASSFLASPVELETVPVYPASYTQAVSPFFLSLSLWVGAFMLVVIYKLFPDGEGVGKVRPRTGYFARLFLFSAFSLLQAAVSSVGEAWILGWKVKSLPLFFFASFLSALAFSAVIYAMAVCMGKLGKALALVAVMIQIPSSGGMYPVSLLPGAYRALYPVLPFTYSIDLFRSAVAGGRGASFAKDSIFLLLFPLAFTCAAALLFPALSSLQKSLNSRLKAADFFAAEGEDLPSSSRLEEAFYLRLSSLPRAKAEMDWERFKRRYFKAATGVCAFFFALPLVPMILMLCGEASRTLFLFVWVGSYSAGMITAAGMEYVRMCAEKAALRRL